MCLPFCACLHQHEGGSTAGASSCTAPLQNPHPTDVGESCVLNESPGQPAAPFTAYTAALSSRGQLAVALTTYTAASRASQHLQVCTQCP